MDMNDADLDKPISINCSVQELAYGMACSDFITSFEVACEGAELEGDWDSLKSLTLEQIMEITAPNGFRFIHNEQFEIEAGFEMANDVAAALEFMKREIKP